MKFVKTEDLKVGMRLARPIYNKQGVLLFERDSKLMPQTITSVEKFGLLGVYILEPTEPLMPMSEEDIEFERFQTVTVFSLEEELQLILDTKHHRRLLSIAGSIIKQYGHMDTRRHFYQNLRSREDFVYKHSVNVAILSTMIAHTMNARIEDLTQAVHASLLHDIGKISFYKNKKDAQELLFPGEEEKMFEQQISRLDILETVFSDGPMLRRICRQAAMAQKDLNEGVAYSGKLLLPSKILLVANRYDEITAMRMNDSNSDSEVRAIKEFMAHPEIYDPKVVDALIKSIYILFPGVSVELNTGEKGLIIAENPFDILRPVLLGFADNSIIDLSQKANSDIEIVDVMKTLDNRYVIDTASLERAGI